MCRPGDGDGTPPITPRAGNLSADLELTMRKVIQVGALGRTRFTDMVCLCRQRFRTGWFGRADQPASHVSPKTALAHRLSAYRGQADGGVGRRRTALREHNWASALAESAGSAASVPGVGCSDCRCRSHLFQFAGYPARDWLIKAHGAKCIVLRCYPKGESTN
jgi:hypothetical protein